jgi:hypothetical protein
MGEAQPRNKRQRQVDLELAFLQMGFPANYLRKRDSCGQVVVDPGESTLLAARRNSRSRYLVTPAIASPVD